MTAPLNRRVDPFQADFSDLVVPARGAWLAEGLWISEISLPDSFLPTLRQHADETMRGKFDLGRSPIVDPWRRKSDAGALQLVDNPHWADSVIRDLATSKIIGQAAALLTQSPQIRLWACQLLYKPGGGSIAGAVGWHQDMEYWQCAEPANLLTAWVPLDDCSQDNGGIQYIPGSHKLGVIGMASFLNSDLEAQNERLRRTIGDFYLFRPNVRAGQICFHHCLTLHSSRPNFSKEPRRALSIHLMPGDTRYRSGSPADRHLNVKLLQGKPGELFAGEYFPITYDEQSKNTGVI